MAHATLSRQAIGGAMSGNVVAKRVDACLPVWRLCVPLMAHTNPL